MSKTSRITKLVDAAIATLSPGRAAKRAAARLRLTALEGARKYAGAEIGRLTSDMAGAFSTSADAELLGTGDLDILRNRSRELNQNNPHAAAATNTMVTHTVGGRIRIRAKCTSDSGPLPPNVRFRITEEMADVANDHAESAFETISNSIDGYRMSFSELLWLEDRQELECGESLLHLVQIERPDTPITTAVEPIEPDRLATPYDKIQDDRIRNGVEYDEAMTHPVAYWIAKRHPGDATLTFKSDNDFDRISAENIIHNYRIQRPGQSRGVPWFAPALTYFQHAGKYMEAEVIAARIAACIAGAIRTPHANEIANAMGETQSDATRHEKFRAGQWMYLEEGQEIDLLNPTRPGAQFVPAMHEFLRAIGAALDIPYVIFARDFENVNYSSMRAAMVNLQRYVVARRWRKTTRVIRPLWNRFYDEAVILGAIRAPAYVERQHDYRRFRVQWPQGQWVDPEKEVKADILAVASGLVPHDFIAAKYEMDAQEIIKAIQREEEDRKAAGLPSQLSDSERMQRVVEAILHAETPDADGPVRKNGQLNGRLVHA